MPIIIVEITDGLLRWARWTVRYFWPLMFVAMLVATSLTLKSGMWFWSERWVTCVFSWTAAAMVLRQMWTRNPKAVIQAMLTCMVVTFGKIISLLVFFEGYDWPGRIGATFMWLAFTTASVASATSNILSLTIFERNRLDAEPSGQG